VLRKLTALFVGLLPATICAQSYYATAVGGLPFPEAIHAVASGNGLTVAAGASGTIDTTSDGTTWTRREISARADLRAAAWSGSLFCAAGDGGSILTSPDGVIWTARSSGTTIDLAAATAGNGTLMVAGDAGRLFTSADGATWSAQTVPTIARINGATYGASGFVAVDESGQVFTSPDGVAWTVRANPATGALSSVAYGAGLYVAVGAGGEVFTSPDGVAWTVRRSGQFERLWCIAATASGFVACGSGGVILTSGDGLSWASQALPGAPLLRSVTQGASGWFAVSESGGLWKSPDGSTWTSASAGSRADLSAVATGGTSGFVAVGNGGTILTSPDGHAWTSVSSPSAEDLTGIAFGGSKFVAVGAGGTILASSDGQLWQPSVSGSTSPLSSVAYGSQGFVALGQAGLVLHSPDGETWTAHAVPGAKGDFLDVTSGNGLYVAVGQWGQIATSSNGQAWSLLPDDPATEERWYDLAGIAFSDGRFVISTHFATSFTSTDGAAWTKRSAAMVPGRDFHGAAPCWDRFAVFGDDGTIQLSTDGAAWTDLPRATGARLFGGASMGDIAVFVGERGAIVQAANVWRETHWTAYHDSITQPDNAPNVTSGVPTADAALVDFSTGSAVGGVTIRFAKTVGTSGGLKTDANDGNPVLGGDAATVFGGIIGFGSEVWDLGKNTGTATVTIGGLNPNKIYDLALFATRDRFSSQTRFVLGGAASFTSAHSAGYLEMGGTPSGAMVSFSTGDGATAAGRVARWSDLILSGTTLTITVTSPDPANNSCLIPQAIRLREMSETPVIVAAPASVDADAGDPVTLGSSVLGTGVSFQWYRRDRSGSVTAVPGATALSLEISSLVESAQYFIRATASGGSVDSASATVIALRAYDQWADWKGLPSGQDAEDEDADGLANLVEYAMGSDPHSATPPLSVSLGDPPEMVMAFNSSKEAVDIAMAAEVSSTLGEGSWATSGTTLQQIAAEHFAVESWEVSVPGGTPRTFLRLRVERN
jgi:hypothetical protein